MMAALGGMASGLLSKAAKPLLGKAMGGIGNAIGGLFGGGKKKKQQQSTPSFRENATKGQLSSYLEDRTNNAMNTAGNWLTQKFDEKMSQFGTTNLGRRMQALKGRLIPPTEKPSKAYYENQTDGMRTLRGEPPIYAGGPGPQIPAENQQIRAGGANEQDQPVTE